jgi:hypothetical protein
MDLHFSSRRANDFIQDIPEKLADLTKQPYKIKIMGRTCLEDECCPLLIVAEQQQ